MFGQLFAIARNTFTECLRQPVYFVLVIAGGILQIVNTLLSAYSMGYTEQMEVHGDDKMLLDMGLATVLVCSTLLAAFLATSAVSREIENKTALTVVSKPVGRPLFVIGKYLGVAGAIGLAAFTMLIFFLFAIRHGVMSTARDTVDGPVVLFSSIAVLGSIGLGIWGNYFYGWVFSSTAVGCMAPATLVAYLATMCVSQDWVLQSIGTEFKPQITLAAACVLMVMLVLTAVAVACSTRLGQVMTIVVCAGVFILGLLSNHLIGRYVFTNSFVTSIKSVEFPREQTTLDKAAETATLTLKAPPTVLFEPGTPIYYASDPNGASMATPRQARFTGDPSRDADVRAQSAGPALVIRNVESPTKITVVNVNNLSVSRVPRADDYVFTKPSTTNWLARSAWSVLPNVQFFWLVDAITQGHTIPPRYVGILALYACVQIVGLLGIAIFLFEGRDLG